MESLDQALTELLIAAACILAALIISAILNHDRR